MRGRALTWCPPVQLFANVSETHLDIEFTMKTQCNPLTPSPFYEYWFVNTGEIVFVKIVFAWTEDRALRGRNPSADPRLKAMGRVS